MEIFKFQKEDVTRHIEYELRTLDKFKEPLNYVIKCLDRLKHSLNIKSLDGKINLNKVKEREGKNYHWSTFSYKNATLVVRRYRQHLTIFTKVDKGENKFGENKIEYGAFTMNTDMDKFGEKHDKMLDKYSDNPFIDLNVIVKDLFKELIKEKGSVHWVWNSVTIKRPDHVKIHLTFSGNSINSIDDFVFCMEELENAYQELLSETTIIQILKGLKTGDKLNEKYKIGKITTSVKDDYYHDVGMELIDISNKNKKEFKDVYCLTRWYFEDLFKEKFYLYNGEIYIRGGKFKVSEPVAYKNIDDTVTLFKTTFPKENFIPLKKFQ